MLTHKLLKSKELNPKVIKKYKTTKLQETIIKNLKIQI